MRSPLFARAQANSALIPFSQISNVFNIAQTATIQPARMTKFWGRSLSFLAAEEGSPMTGLRLVFCSGL